MVCFCGKHVSACSSCTEKMNPYPIKFPLPPSGQRDPFFFEARSRWYELAVPCKANRFRPPVKSVVDLKPGNVKGRRYIVFESARQYFERLVNNDTAPAQAEPQPERKPADPNGETSKLARLRDQAAIRG